MVITGYTDQRKLLGLKLNITSPINENEVVRGTYQIYQNHIMIQDDGNHVIGFDISKFKVIFNVTFSLKDKEVIYLYLLTYGFMAPSTTVYN